MLRGRPFQVQSFADLEEFFRRSSTSWRLWARAPRCEDAPSRDHPEGAQPPEQHLHPVQGPGDRRRRGQRLALGQLRGPQRARGGRGRARSAGPGSGLRARSPAARAPSGATSGRPRGGVRRRAQQVRATTAQNRTQDAARPLRDGRYLGLVLFSAQQFRSQVQRRVVGNAGPPCTAAWMPTIATQAMPRCPWRPRSSWRPPQGRADGASSALHPAHLRSSPRPSVLGGREGIERFLPRAMSRFPTRSRADYGHSTAASSSRRSTLRSGRRQEDVRRALAATRRERPGDALAYFTACLGKRIAGEVVLPRRGIPAVRRGEDGYGA